MTAKCCYLKFLEIVHCFLMKVNQVILLALKLFLKNIVTILTALLLFLTIFTLLVKVLISVTYLKSDIFIIKPANSI